MDDCRGVGVLSGLMEGVGGASDGGGGEASGGADGGAMLGDDGGGRGGIPIGRFIGSLDCNDSAESATDADDGSPLLLLAVVLLAVVGAAPESMMTALLIRAKPMLVTFSPSLVWRCMALPASRCVWEPDGYADGGGVVGGKGRRLNCGTPGRPSEDVSAARPLLPGGAVLDVVFELLGR